jgi:hypothetical protein
LHGLKVFQHLEAAELLNVTFPSWAAKTLTHIQMPKTVGYETAATKLQGAMTDRSIGDRFVPFVLLADRSIGERDIKGKRGAHHCFHLT